MSLVLAAPVRPLRIGGMVALVSGILAVHVVKADLLPLGAAREIVTAEADPVVATVGGVSLRVSDLIAQAGANARESSPDMLMRAGFLDDAAQQLALAQAAEADGLADALEVRAALALARRRVLSEAYLDLAISRAATDAAVREIYDAEVASARAHDRIAVSLVTTTTQEGARTVRRRLDRGESFARVADAWSKTSDGERQPGGTGLIHPDDLPDGLANLAASAPIGTIVGPVDTGNGWTIFRVDTRRRLTTPAFEDREPAIRAALRAEAMAAAARRAEEMTAMDITRPAPEGTEIGIGGTNRAGAEAQSRL